MVAAHPCPRPSRSRVWLVGVTGWECHVVGVRSWWGDGGGLAETAETALRVLLLLLPAHAPGLSSGHLAARYNWPGSVTSQPVTARHSATVAPPMPPSHVPEPQPHYRLSTLTPTKELQNQPKPNPNPTQTQHNPKNLNPHPPIPEPMADDDDDEMPMPMASAKPSVVDTDSRDGALRAELVGVRQVNTVIEGVVASLEKAKENMEV